MKTKILTLLVFLSLVLLISGVIAQNLTLPKPPQSPASFSSKNITNSSSGYLPVNSSVKEQNFSNLFFWILGIIIIVLLIFIIIRKYSSGKYIRKPISTN